MPPAHSLSRWTALVVLLLVSVVGCTDTSAPTATRPPSLDASPVLRTTIVEGPTADRLHPVSGAGVASLRLTALQSTDRERSPILAQIARVDPPIVDRVQAQASSIRATVVNGQTFVIVGYNTQGGNKGAIDVFNVTDPAAPQLIQSLLFSGTTINAVAVRGAQVYLAEGTTDAGLGGTAAIEVMTMGASGAFRLPFQRFGAPGNVGTGIDLVGTTAYLGTGENGGVYKFTTSAAGVLARNGMAVAVRDARAVATAGSDLLVLSGAVGGAAAVSRWTNEAALATVALPGLTDAGAKGDIFVGVPGSSGCANSGQSVCNGTGNGSNDAEGTTNATFAYATLGLGGIAVIDHGAALLRLILPNPAAVAGVNPLDIRANGVTGIPGYLFVSYGGLGVGIVSIPTTAAADTPSPTVTALGTVQLTPAVSANGIGSTLPIKNTGSVFVATGTGLRVLQYTLP